MWPLSIIFLNFITRPLIYLSPYSLFLNPIENEFSKWKPFTSIKKLKKRRWPVSYINNVSNNIREADAKKLHFSSATLHIL